MADHILAVNAGSSSLKCTLFRVSQTENPEPLATAEVSGLNSDEVTFEFENDGTKDSAVHQEIRSHEDGFSAILQRLGNHDKPFKENNNLTIAHRVVHGGDFGHEISITQETIHQLEDLESLAPLWASRPCLSVATSMLTHRFQAQCPCTSYNPGLHEGSTRF